MKNLSILLTVLALASVANAALTISVDGVIDPADTLIDVKPSDTVIIDVTGDGQTEAPLAVWLISEGPGGLAGGDMLYPGTLSSVYSYRAGSGDGFEDMKAWLESEGYVDVMGIGYIELAHGGRPQPPLDGRLVDGIVFHGKGIGDAVLSLVSADLTHVYDTQIIHIPEPITFGLFGVGGLFLRRRR